MRVKILKNPVGLYNLSLEIGEVVDLPEDKANEMIETGHAEKTNKPIGHDHNGFVFGPIETGASKAKTEKR